MHLEKKLRENGKTILVEHCIVVEKMKQIYQNACRLSQTQSETLDLKKYKKGALLKKVLS